MNKILKGKKKVPDTFFFFLPVAQVRNPSVRHKKEWKMEKENIITSPYIAPGVKIIE